FPWADVLAYVITQVVAAFVAALVLLGVAHGQDGFSAKASGFASNGYGDHSPFKYGLVSVLIIEVVLTAIFLYVIIGSTDLREASSIISSPSMAEPFAPPASDV